MHFNNKMDLDLFKYIQVPFGQVQALYPVFQVQMDPKKSRGLTKRNTA